METEKPTVTLVTGNKGKLKEFQSILGGCFNLVNHDIDLPEYQGESEYVAIEKAKLAF